MYYQISFNAKALASVKRLTKQYFCIFANRERVDDPNMLIFGGEAIPVYSSYIEYRIWRIIA